MENQETTESGAMARVPPPASGSVDPFPKWKWMMDYCRERKWHPSDFWDLAEKAWCEKFEPNDQVELPPNGGPESKKGVVGG